MNKNTTDTNNAIKFACPSCGKGVTAEAQFAGKEANCPSCNTAINIPFQWAAPYLQKAKVKPNPKRWLMPVVGFTALVAAAGVGGFVAVMATNQMRTNEPDKATQQLLADQSAKALAEAQSRAAADLLAANEQRRKDEAAQIKASAEARRKQAEIARQEEERALAAARRKATLARVTRIEEELGTLRVHLRDIEQKSADYDAQVTNYKMQHKGVIIAIEAAKEGAKAAGDESRTDEERLAGGLVALLGGVYALNEENSEETKEVANALITIEANQQEYKKALLSLREKIKTTQDELKSASAELDP